MIKLRNKTNAEICTENNLANVIATNIVEEETARNRISATLKIIAKAVTATLGPDGSTTLIQKHGGGHLASKDGLDLLKRINFDDSSLEYMIAHMLFTISQTQVNVVGDGSTSAVLVSNALYEGLNKGFEVNHTGYTSMLYKKIAKSLRNDTSEDDIAEIQADLIKHINKLPPKDIYRMLNVLSNIFEREIKKVSNEVSEDMHELDYIATVSNNNDEIIGTKIANLYKKIGKNGRIKAECYKNNVEDEVEFINGINWDFGYMDNCFGCDNIQGVVDYDKPIVFMTNEILTGEIMNKALGPIIVEYGVKHTVDGEPRPRGVIIVATRMDDDAVKFCRLNRTLHLNKKALKNDFTVVSSEYITQEGIDRNTSISALSGATIFDSNKGHTLKDLVENPWMFLGVAESATITKDFTQIEFDDENLDSRNIEMKNQFIHAIEEEIRFLEDKVTLGSKERQLLASRKKQLATVNGRNAVIHVGGFTESEKVTKERLIDDSVKACRSTIRGGYISGGNLVVPKVIYHNFDKIVNEVIREIPYLPKIIRFKDSKCADIVGTTRNGNAKLVVGYFLQLILNAFSDSYAQVLNNNKKEEDEIEEIISKCIAKKMFFNTREYRYERDGKTKIINPTETDIQIMKNSFSIIGILATSNQVAGLVRNYETSKK